MPVTRKTDLASPVVGTSGKNLEAIHELEHSTNCELKLPSLSLVYFLFLCIFITFTERSHFLMLLICSGGWCFPFICHLSNIYIVYSCKFTRNPLYNLKMICSLALTFCGMEVVVHHRFSFSESE